MKLFLLLLGQLALSADVPCNCEPDPSWPINEVTVRGSHNSYHIRHRDQPSAPDWWYTHVSLTDQLENYGIRHFEITIQPPVDGARDFEVAHVPSYDRLSNCGTFRQCIQEAYDWARSPRTKAVTPLYFIIESKFELTDDEWDLIDEIVSEIWRDDVITPDDVRVPGLTLKESLLRGFGGHWPSLQEAEGKAFFIVADKWQEYIRPNLEGRQAFVYGPEAQNYTVFRKFDDPTRQPFLDDAVRAGYIVRTRSDADFVEAIDTLNDESVRYYFFLVMDIDRNGIVIEELKAFFDANNFGLPDIVYEEVIPLLFEACEVDDGRLDFEEFICVNELIDLIDLDLQSLPLHEDYDTLEETIERRESARRSGAHHISTDYVIPTGQGYGDFFFVLDPALPNPFSTVAVCNRVFHPC